MPGVRYEIQGHVLSIPPPVMSTHLHRVRQIACSIPLICLCGKFASFFNSRVSEYRDLTLVTIDIFCALCEFIYPSRTHFLDRLTKRARAPAYRTPDNCMDIRKRPLFMAREVMRGWIEQINAQGPRPRGCSSG